MDCLTAAVCWGGCDKMHVPLLFSHTSLTPCMAPWCHWPAVAKSWVRESYAMLNIGIFMNCNASSMNENHSAFFWSYAPFSSINFGSIKQRLCWISFEWDLCLLLRTDFTSHILALNWWHRQHKVFAHKVSLKTYILCRKSCWPVTLSVFLRSEHWKPLLQLFFSFTLDYPG